MPARRKFYEMEDYISDLKRVRSEVSHILEEGSQKEFRRAARYYPRELNRIVVNRNIKTSILGPFIIDLPVTNGINQSINLQDINSGKTDIEQLEDIVHAVSLKLEDLE